MRRVSAGDAGPTTATKGAGEFTRIEAVLGTCVLLPPVLSSRAFLSRRGKFLHPMTNGAGKGLPPVQTLSNAEFGLNQHLPKSLRVLSASTGIGGRVYVSPSIW